MILDNRSRRSVAVGAVAATGTVGVLFVLGGVPGLLFGLAATAAWVVAPPVFAFAVGQAGLAAVVEAPFPPVVAIGELTVLAFLFSDPDLPLTARTWALPALGTAVLAGIVWAAVGEGLAAVGVVCLAGLAVLAYAVHRYELLATGQLSEGPTNE